MNGSQRFTTAAFCLALTLASPLPCPAASAPPAAGGPWRFDTSVSPCDDFYQYVCGAWMRENPVPPDQSSWGRIGEMVQRNQETLRQILETASADDPRRSPSERQVGDFYASCMDEKGIEERGTAPLAPALARIAALQSKRELAPLLAHLHGLGAGGFFVFYAAPDAKDSTAVIASVVPGGMGLGDRDSYLDEEARQAEQRKAYLAHVQRMLELSGEPPAEARAGASMVLELETALAGATLDAVSRRDPAKRYHKMGLHELEGLTPEFDWHAYLAARQVPPAGAGQINVAEPDYAKGFDRLLATTDLPHLRAYLRWQLLLAASPMLPAAFVAESFGFYRRTLAGVQEAPPRWRHCVRATEDALGEELGRVYVERNFPPETRARIQKMVAAIESAMEANLSTLPWMSSATRQQALAKLHRVTHQIGHPDAWRDSSRLAVVRGDALGNVQRAEAFALARQLARIGKPVERGRWTVTPQTVNAFYEPRRNEMTFPAGYLQPPAFDAARDEAYNLGALGQVIGHELTHAFDDEGRQFDAHGNLVDWWTPADAEEFERRAACFADQYSGYTVAGGSKLDGRLTLGENVADHGGARIAFMAFQEVYRDSEPRLVDGLTPEQRFFVGRAQLSCENRTPENESRLARTGPHAPRRHRVNGVNSNLPEFRRAFACKEDAPMVRKNSCRVW